jgi:predicted permease
MGYVQHGEAIDREGEALPPQRRPFAGKNMVTPQYFETMGVPIVRGRAFRRDDDGRSPPVAVVNQRFADLVWPGRDPVGRRFSASGPAGPWLVVVGVTPTGKYRLLFEGPSPYFYVPMAQQPTPMRVLQVRSPLSPEALAPILERLIQQLEPDLPVYDVQSMRRALDGGYGFFLLRVAAIAVAVFGALAVALAAVGIYGIVSFLAGQRTREIGVRVALGAARADVLRLVLRDGLALVALGIGLGLAIALAAFPLVGGLLFGVSARDPMIFVSVAATVGAVAAVSSVVPAWRALRIDPAIALRAE